MAIFKSVNRRKTTLKTVLEYVVKESKVEHGYVDGIECNPENSYNEFMAIKNMYHKTGKREYMHFIHSFPPDDPVTYELAHKLSMQIANKYFKGFQVVVATHEDREHIHSHIIVNSVSFTNGKKIQMSQRKLERIKQFSNELCAKYGLSICPLESRVDDYKLNEQKVRENGYSWKAKLIKSIDFAMKHAISKAQFFRIMNKLGYTVTWEYTRKNITYTTPER